MTIWSLTIMWLTRDKNVCLYYVQLHIPIWRKNMWKQLLSWATYCSYLLHVLKKKKKILLKFSLRFLDILKSNETWKHLHFKFQQYSNQIRTRNVASEFQEFFLFKLNKTHYPENTQNKKEHIMHFIKYMHIYNYILLIITNIKRENAKMPRA